MSRNPHLPAIDDGANTAGGEHDQRRGKVGEVQENHSGGKGMKDHTSRRQARHTFAAFPKPHVVFERQKTQHRVRCFIKG